MEPSFRKEVRTFVNAAETLLSPILLGKPLTPEEHKVIEFYAQALMNQCADSPPPIPSTMSPDLEQIVRALREGGWGGTKSDRR
jgi:hypothetical protein